MFYQDCGLKFSSLFYTDLSQMNLKFRKTKMTYHIPDKVGQPVEEGLYSTNELHVFSLVHSLLDEKDHKTGRHKGHGKDDANGHEHVHRCCHPGKEITKDTTGVRRGQRDS